MTLEEENIAFRKIILDFGNASSDVFDQMIKGNWVDDHGHPVRNNISMMGLAMALQAASEHAAANGEWHHADT